MEKRRFTKKQTEELLKLNEIEYLEFQKDEFVWDNLNKYKENAPEDSGILIEAKIFMFNKFLLDKKLLNYISYLLTDFCYQIRCHDNIQYLYIYCL